MILRLTPERFDRRALLSRGAILLAVPGALAAAACGGDKTRPLSPIFQNWIVSLHPTIERELNAEARRNAGLGAVVAPSGGVDIADFVREAKSRTSSWDIYVGMTPFVEMARLVDAQAIEPWDDYITQDVLQDALPQVRKEATLAGHLYSWPFLLDVIVLGMNGELVERAGLDPSHPPSTWDEYIASARTIVESGVAPFGCTFDPRGWRSLVPIAHSLATDVYTGDGLFDFTHPAAVEALELMRRMVELSHPDVLEPEAVLASINPDEAAFAAQTVAYSIKYQNAHVRFASGWPDPTRLRVASLPRNGGRGGTVYWATGIALLRYGKRKREAATYAEAMTHDERIWRRSMGTGREAAGQPAAFRSLPGWSSPRPHWLASWVSDVTTAFRTATAIPAHVLGEQQFTVSRPHWEEYLRGTESQASRAMARAMAAVRKEAASIKD
jgi:multiple sugar transport system substrate-binding protein